MKPLYLIVVSKPSHLLLGIISRILLYLLDCKRQFPFAIKVTEQFLVTYRVERILVPKGEEPAGLIEQSRLHHGIHTLVDVVEKLLTFAP